MSKLDDKLMQDRALREAAKALVKADLTLLRQDWAPGAVVRKFTARAGTMGCAAKADTAAWGSRHWGLLAAAGGTIISAAAFWFARNPILKAIGLRDQPAKQPEADIE